jgi:acetyl-CoA hydrolase
MEIAIEAVDGARLVRPGDLVAWSQSSAEPLSLTASLLQRCQAVGGFRAFIGITNGASMDPAFADCVAYTSY